MAIMSLKLRITLIGFQLELINGAKFPYLVPCRGKILLKVINLNYVTGIICSMWRLLDKCTFDTNSYLINFLIKTFWSR